MRARSTRCCDHALLIVLTRLIATDRAQLRSVRGCSRDVLPGAGQRHPHRRRSSPTRASRFQAMKRSCTQFRTIVQKDPAVASVVGLHRRPRAQHRQRRIVNLKPLAQRKLSAMQVVAAPAAEARCGDRARGSSCRRRRTCASAAGRRRRVPVHPDQRRSDGAVYKWTPKL